MVVLTVPLTSKTKGMFNEEMFSHFKDGSVLVNISRGAVVNEKDLVKALESGILSGAVLDVFENEPPLAVEHPLLHAKNTVVTPHVAFASKEALEARADIVFANIAAFLEGKPQNIVK